MLISYISYIISFLFLISETMVLWIFRDRDKMPLKDSIMDKVFGMPAYRLDLLIILGVFMNIVLTIEGFLYNGIINIIVVGLYSLALKNRKVDLKKDKRFKLCAVTLAILGTAPTVFFMQIIPTSFIMCLVIVLVLWVVGLILRVSKSNLVASWQIAVALFITVYDGATILGRLGFM